MATDDDDDPGDLAGLCHRLRPQLVGALTLHTGDRAVAEELAQETLVRLWQRWPRVSQLDSPPAWAHRVATNLARSWWRRRAAERRAHQRLGADRGRPAVTGADDVMALREAVAGLPRRQREALVWRHYLHASADEAAAAMGCAPATVRALCRQGLANLAARGLVADAHQETPDG